MGDVAAALTWPLTRPAQPGGLVYMPSTRVRRCLFGPVDHEKIKLKLSEEYEKRYKEDTQRWNFDFSRGRPLSPGRYGWEDTGAADPSDADSNGGSATQIEKEKPVKLEQTQITDFMRKRKSSNQKDSPVRCPKIRRRSST